MRFLAWRGITNAVAGSPFGPDAEIFKLYWSEYHREVSELATHILGLDAVAPQGRRPVLSFRTDDPGAPNSSASWAGVFLNARAGTIYGGTSEIQRNILAERVLGLPRELAAG
jgi:alkylation response protein AidB-like acyl-CoA dehydrogenase